MNQKEKVLFATIIFFSFF